MLLSDAQLVYRRELRDRLDPGRMSRSRLEYLSLMAEARVEFDEWDKGRAEAGRKGRKQKKAKGASSK